MSDESSMWDRMCCIVVALLISSAVLMVGLSGLLSRGLPLCESSPNRGSGDGSREVTIGSVLFCSPLCAGAAIFDIFQ